MTSTSDGGTITFDPIPDGHRGGDGNAPENPNCTEAQRAAAELAKIFEKNASVAGGISLGSAVVTAGAGVGEGPSLGADTPLTAAAASATAFFGGASLAFDAFAAGLDTFAKGGDPAALGNLGTDELMALLPRLPQVEFPGSVNGLK